MIQSKYVLPAFFPHPLCSFAHRKLMLYAPEAEQPKDLAAENMNEVYMDRSQPYFPTFCFTDDLLTM